MSIEILVNELSNNAEEAIEHCKKYIKVVDNLLDGIVLLKDKNQKEADEQAEKVSERHLNIDDFIKLGEFKGYKKAIVDIIDIIHTLMVQNKLRKEK